MTNFLDFWRSTHRPMQESNFFQHNMDRLYEDFLRSIGSEGTVQKALCPACDVEEADGHFVVSMDMPGVGKDAIKLDIVDDTLIVSGQRNEEKKDKKAHRVERSFGRFERSLRLPPGTNLDKIEAVYENGVVKISIPKAEAAKKRSIPLVESKTETKNIEKKESDKARPKNAAAAA